MVEMTKIASGIERIYFRITGKKVLLIFIFIGLLATLVVVSASLGAAKLSLGETFSAIFSKILPISAPSKQAEIVIWEVRLPRILMAIIAGIGLAIAGAAIQGVLQNPLVSPFTLGISAAASCGASFAIVLGFKPVGEYRYVVLLNAFVFAMIACALVNGIAYFRRMTKESIILTGIAIMYLFSAITTFLQYCAHEWSLRVLVLWLMGDLAVATWWRVMYAIPVVALACIVLIKLSWDLNAMALGDEVALSLGTNVRRTRVLCLILASLVVATIVCFTGPIGFICLVSPHIARLIIGSDNRFVLPSSCLIGAVLLLGADTASRLILAPTELPVGVLTAFLGVPFFLYLLMKKGREYWL